VNSTFYVGPGPPRTLEDDFAPRAIPLISRLGSLLGGVELVLHATDRTFDLDFDRLPAHHRYVGPLGIWEPPLDPPRYLDATNEPWALVTLSSQAQDDGPLAQAAVEALASRPFPTVMTLGPAHGPEELRSVPGHVRTERFVSHAAILERGRLLVSHAGHGSVMKALWFGCPMVLVPWGRDQPGVAARADALGVARVVPRDSVSADALGSAIDEVLADELTRTRARQHGERLRATDPAGHAASLVEALL